MNLTDRQLWIQTLTTLAEEARSVRLSAGALKRRTVLGEQTAHQANAGSMGAGRQCTRP